MAAAATSRQSDRRWPPLRDYSQGGYIVVIRVRGSSTDGAMLLRAGLKSDAGLTTFRARFKIEVLPLCGPVAQLGARMNGIHEVTGSTPVWSTTLSFPPSIGRK